jgi:hypothetical protein
MGFLTDRAFITGLTYSNLFHIVDVNDVSQGNPDGSSYKASIGQFVSLFDNQFINITGGTMTGPLIVPTISASTYQNLPTGYYDTTGITTSQSITWDKTYWGISGLTNVDITLPSTTSKDGYSLIIKDEGGTAGTYRIRVTPTSGLIDGNTYIDMNINYMSLTFVARNNNWWII